MLYLCFLNDAHCDNRACFRVLKLQLNPWILLVTSSSTWMGCLPLPSLFEVLFLSALPLAAPATTKKPLFFYSHLYGQDHDQVVAISLRLPSHSGVGTERIYKKEWYLASMPRLEHNGSPIRSKLVLWESLWECSESLCESAVTPQVFPSSSKPSIGLSCAPRECSVFLLQPSKSSLWLFHLARLRCHW